MKKPSNVQRLDSFRIAAYWGILAVFILIASMNGFLSMWKLPATWHESAPFIARVILFFLLVILAIRWVVATNHELHLWKEWLENPVQQRDVYAAIAILSLTLGVCLAYAYNIVLITLIFTAYLLLNYWTQWLSNDHFARALPESKRKLQSELQRGVLHVLELYWLKRPQLARITTLMFFASIAFSLALAGAVQRDPAKHRCQLAATILLILDVFVGEIVIAWWRHKREQGIAQAKASELRIRPVHRKEVIATETRAERLATNSTAAYYAIFAVAIGMAGLGVGIAGSSNVRLTNFVFPFTWDLQSWPFLASVLFFLELLSLSFFWIQATGKELELWRAHLTNPIDKQQVFLAMLGLSLVLGTALAFFYSVVLISEFIALYLLVNYWTQWLSNDHFERALERTRENPLDPGKKTVLCAMEEYWMKRPQLARITTMMFFASLAFSIALAGFVQKEPFRHWFFVASYCILVLDILVGEIVIFVWRNKRDHAIEEVEQA